MDKHCTLNPKQVLFLLLALFQYGIAGAQLCGVHHEDEKPHYRVIPPNNTAGKGTAGTAYIPLQFHVVCSTGSNANWYRDTNLINRAIDTANVAFKGADMQFCKAGVDIIENDTFANIDHYSLYFHYRGIYTDTTVLHVYIPEGYGGQFIGGYSFQSGGNSTGGNAGKYVYGGSGQAITIGGWILPYSQQDKWILSHELGHFFGLRHPSDFTYNGYELVDKSNCDTTADYCCGTPAEYVNIYTDANCQLIPALNTEKDDNGDLLMPDPKNIMSASSYSQVCREHFVPDQLDRIKYFRRHYLSHLYCAGTSTYTVQKAGFGVSIFPNPATVAQTVRINTPMCEHMKLLLQDMQGKLVQVIYDGMLQAGEHNFEIDAESLSPGMYLVKIAGDKETLYRKVVKQ